MCDFNCNVAELDKVFENDNVKKDGLLLLLPPHVRSQKIRLSRECELLNTCDAYEIAKEVDGDEQIIHS